MSDILQVQGINSKGFGTIPKLLMQDHRLTIESKAIYAYFCSYAGGGTQAFPGRDKIMHDLKIGKDRYYNHLKLLKQYGYIEIKQNVDEKGKFKNNIYTLLQIINPCPDNRDTNKNPCPDNTDTDDPYTDDKDNNINNININSININRSINQSSKPNETNPQNKIDKIDNNIYEEYMDIVKDNIEYESLVIDFKDRKDILDEMLNIIVLNICTNKPYIRVKGIEESSALVKSQLLKLNSEHIKYVDHCMQESTTKKSNIHNYLLTALYNAPTSMGNYFQALVKHDIYGNKDNKKGTFLNTPSKIV